MRFHNARAQDKVKKQLATYDFHKCCKYLIIKKARKRVSLQLAVNSNIPLFDTLDADNSTSSQSVVGSISNKGSISTYFWLLLKVNQSNQHAMAVSQTFALATEMSRLQRILTMDPRIFEELFKTGKDRISIAATAILLSCVEGTCKELNPIIFGCNKMAPGCFLFECSIHATD